ncbi:5-bromo-4-chloroindolyl phosphate hydrolysis family protein [Yokenella regensburgei]|uniref:5-bromo-4-chloroindolyl phosphate hydrolysis family protein n=1 Tax=Yokenella regensburgei TaxID=158877 RepID=UPI003F15E27D
MKTLKNVFNILKKIVKLGAYAFISFAVALIYIVAISDMSDNTKKLILTNDDIQALILIMLWISFFVIFYEKKKIQHMFISSIAGAISLFFGMLIIMPLWIALMNSMLLSFTELHPDHQHDAWTITRITLIIISVTLYNFAALPEISIIYYIIFSVIFLLEFGRFIETKPKSTPTKIDANDNGKTEDILESKSINYTNLITELKCSSQNMAPYLSTKIIEIAVLAKNIMCAIEEDKRDEIQGKAFLNRYLPYLNKIIQNYLKITKQNPEDEVVNQGMLASLNALESAFKKQYLNLLENDVQDLTVDLNVLDALLKMDGYKE